MPYIFGYHLSGNEVKIVFIQAEKCDVTFQAFSHLVHQVIIGIEDGIAARQYTFDHHRFHAGHVFYRIDVFQAKMIGCHIRDDTYIAIVKTQAGF